MSHESAIMSVAAKVALANKRKRDDSTEIFPVNHITTTTATPVEQKSPDTETKTEEKDERTEGITVAAETEKVTTEKVKSVVDKGKDMLPPPAATSPIPCSSSSSQRAKKTVTISLPVPAPVKEMKKSGKNQKFEYGNYNRYYGYRNPGACMFPGAVEDSRLYHFRPEWFFGKDVLVTIFFLLSYFYQSLSKNSLIECNLTFKTERVC